jgi:hypothetical protein
MAVSKRESFRLGAPGQMPLKRTIPTLEMIAGTIAICLQSSPLGKMPQKVRDALMNPRAETSQKGAARRAAARGDRDGAIHARTGTAVRVPDVAASPSSAKNAFAWATPCSSRLAVIRILMRSGDTCHFLPSGLAGQRSLQGHLYPAWVFSQDLGTRNAASGSARSAVLALLATAGLLSDVSGEMARTAFFVDAGPLSVMMTGPVIAQLLTKGLGSRRSVVSVRVAPGTVPGMIETWLRTMARCQRTIGTSSAVA